MLGTLMKSENSLSPLQLLCVFLSEDATKRRARVHQKFPANYRLHVLNCLPEYWYLKLRKLSPFHVRSNMWFEARKLELQSN
jgi:hypothetical protein